MWVLFGLFFMSSYFYHLDLHNKTCAQLVLHKQIYDEKDMQKLDWKSDLPWFSYGYWSWIFVDFLIGYIGPSQLCALLSVE